MLGLLFHCRLSIFRSAKDFGVQKLCFCILFITNLEVITDLGCWSIKYPLVQTYGGLHNCHRSKFTRIRYNQHFFAKAQLSHSEMLRAILRKHSFRTP